ncbi:MAG: transcriptional regulator [Isosphaeraceae bacterium]|nr:transcriptional regulator [Isosphaeraceae bacterium]
MSPDDVPLHQDEPPRAAEGAAGSDEVIRQFVEHWGVMARSWGINATMGELFALLYITGTDWTAEALRERLRISRGNVSMNLRELMAWGVVHKVHRRGERREFYRAEADVWTLFRRILAERKRRELEPTLAVLDHTAARIVHDPALAPIQGRVLALQRFFALIDALTTRLAALDPADLEDLLGLLDPSSPRR